MAPEQAGGDQVPDARCDFYALGAVGYFLLTGRPPFEGKRALEVLIAHARDPVVPPSHWQAGVPRDLEAVILRCLEKDPGRRFPNAEALEHALAGCAAANSWTPNDSARWWKEQVRAGG
jgi:serine/threonine-protein kinase